MNWKKYIKGRKKIWKIVARDKCAPMIHLSAYCSAMVTKTKDILGSAEKTMVSSVDNGIFTSAPDSQDFVEHSKIALDKLSNSAFFEKINQDSKKTISALKKYALKINKTNFKDKSNKILIEYYKKLFLLWIWTNAYGHVVNLSDFETNLLSNKILKIIKNKIKKYQLKLPVAGAFSILVTPDERSMLGQKDLDFYRIVHYVQKNYAKYQTDRKFKQLLQEFTDKYDWLEFHYDGPLILNQQYFLDLIKSEIKQKTNALNKIATILKSEEELVNKQKRLEKKLKLTDKEKYWIKVAKTVGYLKALRKDIVFQACRSSDNLLQELARRLYLDRYQIRCLTIDELEDLLNNKSKMDKVLEIINQRKKICVGFYDQDGFKFLSGKEAKEIKKYIYEEKVNKEISEFTGTPAYPGKAKGRVKIIIEAGDMKKMEKGDILVSPATNPNLLTAMKKAAAIVTDEGGLTCHAAIVSRELGIICVVGAKIATRVLKDGDLVEVDANKGIVRKIK